MYNDRRYEISKDESYDFYTQEEAYDNDDSEMELFEKLFHDVINKIDLSMQEEIFIPHESMDVHEH